MTGLGKSVGFRTLMGVTALSFAKAATSDAVNLPVCNTNMIECKSVLKNFYSLMILLRTTTVNNKKKTHHGGFHNLLQT